MASDDEVLASDEFFKAVIGIAELHGLDGIDGAFREVGALDGFFDVNRSRLAVGVDSAPVVESKREVALLLNFRKHNARSKSMHRSRRNKHAVAGLDGDQVQAVFDGSALKCRTKLIWAYTCLQASADLAIWLSIKNDPRFGLAVFGGIEFSSKTIVRMHLQRQPVVRIEELDEQRKLFAVRMSTEQFSRIGLNQRCQGLTSQRSAGDTALTIRMVCQLPAFGIIRFRADRLAKKRTQLSSAPADAFQDRFEDKRRKHATRTLPIKWRFGKLKQSLRQFRAPRNGELRSASRE